MRPITKSLLLTCFFVFLSQPVFAADDDVSIVGGLTYNLKRTQFDVSSKAFRPEYTTIEWSIIAAYQSFYVKAGFDQSIKDHTQINNTASGGGGGGSIDNGGVTFSREEINMTFGYSVLDNLSLFAGYTQGETIGILPGQIEMKNVGMADVPVFATTSVSFKQAGPFVGASYSYFLQDSGSFNFGLAYAKLDGDVFFRNVATVISDASVIAESSEVDGESTGASYTISWTDRFSEDMLYNLTLKTVRYKFKEPSTGSNNLDFDDVYNIFSIGFSKFF